MKTSSFAGIVFEVQSDGMVRLSLETQGVDLSIYMSHEEYLMFVAEAANILTDSKKRVIQKKQAEELQREQRR